ncbi:CU044_5270 family protein [Streptomyces longispororuber]|uniref:CU044_5270 family protein n=1 Tax=Streptomyces longispororuber TaxID=68230 RepID=UPI00210E9FF9|nr:CU044_5270 family protein [Streptomyces longispororuber]MCQ4207316.1 CU044_5270 family protein [Streptomyces longispororuber]
MSVDEMNEVREFRDDAPVADRARLAPGRARLTAAATGGGRARRLRTDWRLAAVGAVAVAVAATVLATGLGGDGPSDTQRTAPAATRTVTGTPAEILARAADTVERGRPVPAPRDGQWIYGKSMFGNDGGWPRSSSAPSPKPQTNESWKKYADPRFENGREGDDHSPREQFRLLTSLPDDPAAVLKKVRAFYPTDKKYPETAAQHGFRSLKVILGADPMPPEALAKLYRAMATIPGIQVQDRLVRDLAGRDALAVGLDDTGKNPTRTEILIDPRTYRVLGDRWVVTGDFSEKFPGDSPPRPRKAGEIIYQGADLASGVVDRRGQRP